MQHDDEARGAHSGRRQEVMLAPLLDSLRSNPGDPMYNAFSAQMNHLYQVFKELYDQDQDEIRQLLSALDTQKQHVQALSAERNLMRAQLTHDRAMLRGHAHSAAAAAPASAAAPVVKGQNSATQTDSYLAAALPGPAVGGSGRNASWDARGRGGANGAPAPGRPYPGEAARSPQAAAGLPKTSSGLLSPSASRGAARLPVLILFLPYMLHPAQHAWRFYAAWRESWTTRRTLWLALIWLLVFLVATGLLVGLLVPWGQLGKTNFSVGPQVVAVSASQVSVVFQINRDAMLYYAVLPQAAVVETAPKRRHLAASEATLGVAAAAAHAPAGLRCSQPPCPQPPQHSRRRLAASPKINIQSIETDHVQAIAEWGNEDALLFPFAVACGVAEVPRRDANYTLTVDGHARTGPGSGGAAGAAQGGLIAPLLDECVATYGLQVPNSTVVLSSGPFRTRRCQRCPLLQPSTAYVLLLVGDGGRTTGVVPVHFTTAAAPAA